MNIDSYHPDMNFINLKPNDIGIDFYDKSILFRSWSIISIKCLRNLSEQLDQTTQLQIKIKYHNGHPWLSIEWIFESAKHLTLWLLQHWPQVETDCIGQQRLINTCRIFYDDE